ncbi:MAG: SprT family zinc-dependent metalloprotease [bacterium]
MISEKIKHSVSYGTNEIEFVLELCERKTIQIIVNPDSSVNVKAPSNKNIEEVLNRVKNRASWIMKQKRYFSFYKPDMPERKYISGESHRYLGKQYRLKFIKSVENQIKLQNGYLKVFTENRSDIEFTKTLLDEWYLSHAKIKFQQRLDFCYKKIKKHNIVSIPKLQIRKMTKRWGSCTSDGRIILNLDLVKAPSHCIDYVIIHELCHLKYRNHNADFFNLLLQLIPDWEKRKEKLEKIVFS